jgi:lipopolysaccharide export system protein LptA
VSRRGWRVVLGAAVVAAPLAVLGAAVVAAPLAVLGAAVVAAPLAAQELPLQAEALGSGSATGLEAVIPLSKLDPDSPVSIEAEALEVEESEDGARTLQFKQRVRVEQADLRLRAASLEAAYPAGAKQPERITARGGVRIQKGDREARCDRAEYRRRAQKIFCRGHASVRDGADTLTGELIVLDLANERITVSGATRVALEPRPGDAAKGEGRLGELLEDGPIRIQARGLEASQTSAGRQIAFSGSVQVLQEELALAADRIEARYPPGADEPDAIVAEGKVRIRQGERTAECVRAEYDRPGRTLDCTGPARLAQRGDWVTGDRIEFDLASERLRVVGDARLSVAPRAEEAAE